MKKILTVFLLLLFSVNLFADDNDDKQNQSESGRRNTTVCVEVVNEN